MKLILFTGAGASVELGVPSMRLMAENLHAHLKMQKLSENIFSSFNAMLQEADYDVEKLIETVDSLESGEIARQKIGYEADEDLLKTVRTMRQETEWYIQHKCEQIKEGEACALWNAALRRCKRHDVCIITTNYDRSIEIGCMYTAIEIDDGFADFDSREFATWKGITDNSKLKIIKIHGSTDWYQGEDNLVYKLKHPMPLYGDLSISSNSINIPKLASAMVLPTREKKISQPPYPDLITGFRNAAKDADIAVFLGTSLRDPDILDVFRQCANRIPTYMVNIDQSWKKLLPNPNAKSILQTASEFIVSTLPKFLEISDPEYLNEISINEVNEQRTILPWLVMMRDKKQSRDTICNSIEKLADNNISIDFHMLKPLLEHEDHTVRNYSLALIPNSIDSQLALNTAEDLATAEPNGKFANELTTLKDMMKQQ